MMLRMSDSDPAPARPSPLAMALLSLIWQEPMHAYRMQQLIKERHKDEVVNVAQRNSIYQTLQRLLRAGLIAVRETQRDERRPERTIYEMTPLGRRTLDKWLRAMLATPAREFPEFPAALAFLPVLTPDRARAALGQRLDVLTARVAEIDSQLKEALKRVPRLFLVELEYQHAVAAAELHYVRRLVEDLEKGRLTWDARELRRLAAARQIDFSEKE